MGKALNTIIAATVAVGVFVVAGPQAAALAFTLTQAGLNVVNKPKAPRPDTAVSQQKQAIPPRVKARGRVRLHPYFALFETSSDGSAVDTYAFADGASAGNELIYINDDKVKVSGGVVAALPDKKYQGGNVQLGLSYGAYPNTAFSAVIAKIPSWTTNHRGDGICTGYLIKRPEKDKYFLETYPQGDSADVSRVDKWGYFYDPRDTSQNIADNPTRADMWSGGGYIGSWKWSENPVIHLLDYYVFERGYSYEKRIVPTLQYWIDAANVCDEPVALKNGGTEPRYRACVSYPMTNEEKAVVEAYRETFDGWTQERGDGAFVIYAGKIYPPTITIGPDEIISINVAKGGERENKLDQIKVTYVSDLHDYTEVEATPWAGENGALRVDTLNASTPSFSQNRRLAKRVFDRVNSANRGTVSTPLSGRRIRGHRYITLDYTVEYVENDVVTTRTFFKGLVQIEKVSRNFETGGLDFDWIAIDPNIDSWNPATEEGEGAAVGDRVAPEPLLAPTITSATAMTNTTTAGVAAGVYIRVVAAGYGGADATWFARTRIVGASAWSEKSYPDITLGNPVTINTDYVPTNAMVEVQVSYTNGSGQVSPWSASTVVNTLAPNNPDVIDGGTA